jgi:hypothetical protein
VLLWIQNCIKNMRGLIPMNDQMSTKYLKRKKEELRVTNEKSVKRK